MDLISQETSQSLSVSNNSTAVSRSVSELWGWLPVLSLTCALGFFLVALGAEAGRLSSGWAEPLFWLGLLVMYVPIAVRLISPKPARRERIALIIMLGILLSLFRDIEQPLAFSFNDEFGQWRTALDIAASGHLFQPNPILTISPLYPGLQIVTNALSSMTGLSIFVSGMTVLGVAALLLILSLYLFYEYLGGSALLAGMAMLIYMAKPTFFEDTLYHYEDLAIPLMVFVLFVTIHSSYTKDRRNRIWLTLIIFLGTVGVVVSHHVASFMLVLFLFLWLAIFLVIKINAILSKKQGQKVWASPGLAPFISLILVAAWSAFTGARVINYVFPTIQATVDQFFQILNGHSAARQAFSSSIGYVEPLWERLVSYASVGLIALGLPFGLFQIWRRYRSNAVVLASSVGALAYPITLALRFTNAGVNLGGRSQPYVFEGLVLVLAVGIMYFCVPRLPNWKISLPLTTALTIIFVGGWVLGTSPDFNRLPGSYLSFADQRSIQPQGVAAAEWVGNNIGPGNLLIGDHVNELLMGSYGNQWAVSNVPVTPIMTEPTVDPYVLSLLKRGGIQLIVVDSRLVLPGIGWYYGAGPVSSDPMQPGALWKFDNVQNANRIYDNGDIVIYDVRNLSTTPQSTTTSCTPPTSVSGSYPTVTTHYTGTIYDLPTGNKRNISLSGIQQKQGGICGNLDGLAANGAVSQIPMSGPFAGTITASNQIQFSTTNTTINATFTFEGTILPDGSLAGTYCGKKATSNTCGEYGLWSVSPAK